MARIEISLNEYNNLKDEINNLHQKIGELYEENNNNVLIINELKSNINDIKKMSLFNRIFNFKKTINLI